MSGARTNLPTLCTSQERQQAEERERLSALQRQRLQREREEHAQRHELLMGISPSKGGKARRFGCCSASQSAESTSIRGSLEVDSRSEDANASRRGTVVAGEKGEGGSRVSPRTCASPPSPIPEWGAVIDGSFERQDGSFEGEGGDRILSARQSMLQGSPQPLFPSPPSNTMSISRSMRRSDAAPGSSRGDASRREEGSGSRCGVAQALKHSRSAFASWRSAFDQV